MTVIKRDVKNHFILSIQTNPLLERLLIAVGLVKSLADEREGTRLINYHKKVFDLINVKEVETANCFFFTLH